MLPEIPEGTFIFPVPTIGQEFFFDSGFIPNSEPWAGLPVLAASVDMTVTITGGDASNFFTEIILPVDTDPVAPGVQAYYASISGAEEGWSGTGTFTISRALPDDILGSTFAVPLLFSATTYPDGVEGTVPELSSFWRLDFAEVPAPGSAALLATAGVFASRRRR